MPPKKNLSYNEKILCNASGIFYEAKVIEVGTNEEGNPKYLVHYQGWHKRYDEWINQEDIPDKVKEFSDEALAQAKEELREIKAAKNRKGRKSNLDGLKESASRASTPSENADGSKAPSTTSEKMPKGRGMKRKADDDTAKDPFPKKSDGGFVLPPELKNILIEDADFVNRQTKLYKLPATFTVKDIIDDFCQEVGVERSEKDRVVIEYEEGYTISQDAVHMLQSTRGVQDYFDTLLPYQLLYKLEKLQYSQEIENVKQVVEVGIYKKKGRTIQKPPTPSAPEEMCKPSDKYGLPHLLRLLTRFEFFLKKSMWNARVIESIMKSVADFIVWLNKKRSTYYSSSDDYMVPSPDYMREAYA